MTTYIYAWHPRCPPALDLAKEINGWVVKHHNSNYKDKPGNILVNWGTGHALPYKVTYNQPQYVANAINKRLAFELFKMNGVPTCEYTQNPVEAHKWLTAGYRVLGRDLWNGRGGVDIVVYEPNTVPKAHKYYVKYFRKFREFRVHVFKENPFWVQEKKQIKGQVKGADKYVRAHGRGWCFAFKHLEKDPCPELVKKVSVQAIAALGLDFGAVDIGLSHNGDVCVFEVNTAPGIENTTLKEYGKIFRNL